MGKDEIHSITEGQSSPLEASPTEIKSGKWNKKEKERDQRLTNLNLTLLFYPSPSYRFLPSTYPTRWD